MPPREDELDFRRYLRGLWRRKGLILLVVLLAVNLSLLLSLRQDRVYEGEARVLVSPQVFGNRPGLQVDAALAVQTEIQILDSEPVRALVVRELGPVGKVSAERAGETLLVSVKSDASRPKRAADVTNAYARAYIAFRGGLASGPTSSGGPQDNVSAPSATAQLVAPAMVPSSPLRPKPVKDSILAGILGLLMAVGLASLLEALDDSVKTRAELRKATDLPVLGVIPLTPSWHARRVPAGEVPAGEVPAGDVPAAMGEAFRSLRTSVQLLGVERPLRTLQVTSPGSGDGKTTILANLAVVLARTGQRVAMIDADLRRPGLHEIFGLSNDVGVTSVLADEVPVLGAVQPVGPAGNLVLLASGPSSPNPSELLASKKMAQLIFALSDSFDVVLIDSPPVLAVTDAIVLTTWSEATLLVTCSGRTKRKQLHTTLELLRQAEATLAGTVLNRANAADDSASKYYSYHQQADKVAADRSVAGSGFVTNGHALSSPAPPSSDQRRVGEDPVAH